MTDQPLTDHNTSMNQPTTSQPPTDESLQAFGQSVIDAERSAVENIELTSDFSAAARLILDRCSDQRHGRLVVSGLGKSGIIANKLAATFASTGTPAHFLHPTEAMHGDIGSVRKRDVVLLLSYGGNTEEVTHLAEVLKTDDVPIIAILGSDQCDLGRLATCNLQLGDITEACPHNLAPTASTTAMLAMGDALALTVSRLRNFGVEDFAKVHPGGGLGRQIMPITQAMRFKAGDNLPLIPITAIVKDAYETAQQHAQQSGLRRPGALIVISDAGTLAGIVTDGDLRNALLTKGPDIWASPISDIMTASPTTLADDAIVRDAVHIVREKRFDEIPIVTADGKPVGLIDIQDLVALKVIEA